MNAPDLALALVRTTLATTAACGLAWLLLTKLRIDSPRVHRLAWTLAILQGWLLFPWTFEIESPETPVSRDAVAERVHSLAASPSFIAVNQISLQSQRSHPLLDSPLAAIPIAAWLAGAVALAVAGAYRYARVLRALPLGSPPGNPAWRNEWLRQMEAARIPSRRRVDLRMTTNLGPLLCWTPWTYLVLAPKTLWAALTSLERQSILRHELAHLQRGDLWKSLALRVLALPQWFNPLARLAVRRFDEAGVWACDDAAAGAAAGGPLAFANSLLHAAEFASAELPGSVAAKGGMLSRRIHRLVTPRFKEESKMKRLIVPLLLIAVAALQLIRVERVGAKEGVDVSAALAAEGAPTLDHSVIAADGAVVTTDAEFNAEQDAEFDALAKLPYVIEPPDILLVEILNFTPKAPRPLEKADTVLIRVEGASPDEQPIDYACNVDVDGVISLGPTHGKVRVDGLTVEDAEAAIRDELSKTLSNVKVSAWLLHTAGGQFLIHPNGHVNLDVLGSVYVAGMTLDKARSAIERKLAEKLVDPNVFVAVLSYNSKVVYVIDEMLNGNGYVNRLPVPFPLSMDCNVDSALEQSARREYKLSKAKIVLRRPAPGGVGEELVFPIAFDPSTDVITRETNHPLLPGDRIFVTPPGLLASRSAAYRHPSAASPAPQAAPMPAPVPTTEVAVSPTGDPPPEHLLRPGQRQVIYDIRVLEDAHNSMAEFKPLHEKGFMLADTSTTLGALRILEKHQLIKYLAEPQLVTTLGRAAQLSVGETMSDKAGDRRLRNGTHVEVSAEQSDEQLDVTWLARISRDGADLEIAKKTVMADGQTAIYRLDPPSKKHGKQRPPIYVVLTPTLVK